jgi:hypothetical protein
MCQGGRRGGGGIEAAARGARQAAMEAQVAGAHPGDLPHALFNGRARGCSATRGKGQCRTTAGGACMGMPLVYANRALKVLIRAG